MARRWALVVPCLLLGCLQCVRAASHAGEPQPCAVPYSVWFRLSLWENQAVSRHRHLWQAVLLQQ